MHYLTVMCLMIIPLLIALSSSVADMRDGLDEYNGLEDADNFEHKVERREWCARWGDSCVPDSKVKFAKCCAGMRCDCGSSLLGASGKCQCKKESVFGRR